tara:strand:+ start:20843 stop:21577 length:735 start_codon:yes stop_codon:yes gene_type:complete
MSTDVAVTTSQLPALTDAEKALGTGQGEITTDDLILPKLQISAAKSKYMKEESESYIEGLKEGYIFCTLTEQIYGKEIEIVPIKNAGRNRVLFTPSFGVECKSDNAVDGGHVSPTCHTCPMAEWGSATKGSGSACTLFENMVVDVVSGDGRPRMSLVSFKKKAIETYKKLQTFITMRVDEATGGAVPQYRGKYKLIVAKANGESGPYDVWGVKNAGEVALKDFETVQRDFFKLQDKGVQLGDNE